MKALKVLGFAMWVTVMAALGFSVVCWLIVGAFHLFLPAIALVAWLFT